MTYQPKFKFWDGKTMSPPYSLDDLAYEGFPSQFVDEHGDSVKGAIALQFIGIMDRKGVEMYEGDIFYSLHCYGPGGLIRQLGVVPNIAETSTMLNYKTIESLEVGGNIYENPKLLNNP